MEASGELHAPAALFPGKNSGTHWVEVLKGPRTGLDVLEKINISCPYRVELQITK